MRMKMFAAESLEAAKALIFAEMGDDAIILSEREVPGGVEVRAATDKMGGGMVPSESRILTRLGANPAPRLVESPIRNRVRDSLLWHGAPERFAERIPSRQHKGDFIGVNRMHFSVIYDDTYIASIRTSQRSLLHT